LIGLAVKSKLSLKHGQIGHRMGCFTVADFAPSHRDPKAICPAIEVRDDAKERVYSFAKPHVKCSHAILFN
jgi:hypothetical protein